MCRTFDLAGLFLAFLTVLLLAYGNLIGNYLFIYYWHSEYSYEKQWVKGIPLTGTGLIFAFFFNFFCLSSIVAHQRAGFSNPG